MSAPGNSQNSRSLKPLLNQCCRGGETGRRARLKIWWWQHRVGSSPTLGTNLEQTWLASQGDGVLN